MTESHLSLKHCSDMTTKERSEAYHVLVTDPAFVDQTLATLANDSEQQEVASWFLKHHIDSGQTLHTTQIEDLCAALDQLEEWPAQLHILQILPQLELTGAVSDEVAEFARHSLQADNKFVRAWSYAAFSHLALAHAEYKQEVVSLLTAALENEAPSVRVRIRKALTDFDL